MDSVLEIKNLHIAFKTKMGLKDAVKNVSIDLKKGEILAIAGESGSGKTLSAMSILKLLPQKSIIRSGEIFFENQNILNFNEKQIQNIRGKKIALIPQDPMTSLNPLYTIENQMTEAIKIVESSKNKNHLRNIAIEALEKVHIKDSVKCLKSYPHELSGGMKQRVIIAIALISKAKIIVADEPTTALDVTVQAQIMKLLLELKRKYGISIILISHDLILTSQVADRISVMYNGKIVETNFSKELFKNPKHPYTKALIEALPIGRNKEIHPIKGNVPSIFEEIKGCAFHPRCNFAFEKCKNIEPLKTYFSDDSFVCCHLFK